MKNAFVCMWKLVSFVRRGKFRDAVLESLVIPNNPTDLAKKLNSHRPTVSMVISELRQKGLVKRLNPNEKNISIYGLTKEGKQIVEKIKIMKSKDISTPTLTLPHQGGGEDTVSLRQEIYRT